MKFPIFENKYTDISEFIKINCTTFKNRNFITVNEVTINYGVFFHPAKTVLIL